MADITKLKKQVQKAAEARDSARLELGKAADQYGATERAFAVAAAELEQEEPLEMARDLRAKKDT